MKRLVFILSFITFMLSLYAQKESKDVRAGNKLYEAEKYTGAEVEYRKGLQKNTQSFEGNFNLGNALFRQEKYEEAIKQYNAATAFSEDDKEKLAAAYHNMGNALLVNGQIPASIEAYKMALKNNPKDDETRYNLAFAQELLKKQQQQEQNQNQQNQDDQQQNQDDQQQNQDNNQQQQNDQEQEQDQQNQQQPQSQMSQENAQQILDALLEDEKDTQELGKMTP